MSRIRVADVLAALSLTTDLASGVPFEKGLRTCVVATAFGGVLGLSEPDRSALFHASLLRGDRLHGPRAGERRPLRRRHRLPGGARATRPR